MCKQCTQQAFYLSVRILIYGLRECMHALFISLSRDTSPEQVWAKFRIEKLSPFLFISWNLNIVFSLHKAFLNFKKNKKKKQQLSNNKQ